MIRRILVLSFPLILENLLQALLGSVDTWFAGQLHDTAIAAIGATTLTVNLFLVFYTAVGAGTGAVISRYVGQKNPEKAAKAAAQFILLSLMLGAVLGPWPLCFAGTF